MDAIIQTKNLNLYYGAFQALNDISLEILPRMITSLIGPSGCGKSTLLRVFNRMNDLVEDVTVQGQVAIDGQNIYEPQTDLVELRKKVGMVFQTPNPFPLSVEDNVLFSVKIHRSAPAREYAGILEQSLKAVDLWDILKDQLKTSALNLTLEQQQRLCIARLLPVKPDILLMDEPCSALDPMSTGHIEELMRALKVNYTILIVTHNMQQAARVSDFAGYMLLGELLEMGTTTQIFTNPRNPRTEEYITGRFG